MEKNISYLSKEQTKVYDKFYPVFNICMGIILGEFSDVFSEEDQEEHMETLKDLTANIELVFPIEDE